MTSNADDPRVAAVRALGQVVVDGSRLPAPRGGLTGLEQLAALHAVGDVVRLSDRVPDPEDHLH